MSDSVINNASELAYLQRRNECLNYYFKHETWKLEDALCLLCEINPDNSRIDWIPDENNNGNTVPEIRSYHHFSEENSISLYDDFGYPYPGHHKIDSDGAIPKVIIFEEELIKLKKIWDSRQDECTVYPPHFFIEWAIEKEHHIKWLDWAKKVGFFIDENDSEEAYDEMGIKEIIRNLEIKGKSRTSALKIIFGFMKMKYPGVDPSDDKRFNELSRIKIDLENVGVTIDDTVLSTFLKDAAKWRERHNRRQRQSKRHKKV